MLVRADMSTVCGIEAVRNPLQSRSEKRKAIDVHVGGRLRSARLKCGLSQATLANPVTEPVARINAYEDGGKRIDSALLLRFQIGFFFATD